MWYSCFFRFVFLFDFPEMPFVPDRVLPVSLPKLKLSCASPPLRAGLKVNVGGLRWNRAPARVRPKQNRNRPPGKSRAAMLEQKLSPVLKPLYKVFKVSNLEELIKKVLKLVFILVLLVPL